MTSHRPGPPGTRIAYELGSLPRAADSRRGDLRRADSPITAETAPWGLRLSVEFAEQASAGKPIEQRPRIKIDTCQRPVCHKLPQQA